MLTKKEKVTLDSKKCVIEIPEDDNKPLRIHMSLTGLEFLELRKMLISCQTKTGKNLARCFLNASAEAKYVKS